MVVLGLLLVVLALLAAAGTVFSNGDDVIAKVFGVSLSHVSVGGFFLAGIVTGLIGMLGLSLLLGGGARNRRKRVAAKRDVRSTRGERDSMAEENARLQSELTDARRNPAPGDSEGRGRTLD